MSRRSEPPLEERPPDPIPEAPIEESKPIAVEAEPEAESAPKSYEGVAVGGPPVQVGVEAGGITAHEYAVGKGLVKSGRAAGFLHHAAESRGALRRSAAEWETLFEESKKRPAK